MTFNFKISKTVHPFLNIVWVYMLMFFNNAAAQNINDSVFNPSVIANIKLQNANGGNAVFLNDVQHAKPLTLFIFLSPECPLCQNYSTTLNKLCRQYAANVQMYGIIPGKAYTIDDVKKFAHQYKISFPILIDANKKLTACLHASVTPQVILLNNKNVLLYKGAIDNWVQSLGRQRVNVTEFFLQDALQQSTSNKTVLVKRTKAVGCSINDY